MTAEEDNSLEGQTGRLVDRIIELIGEHLPGGDLSDEKARKFVEELTVEVAAYLLVARYMAVHEEDYDEVYWQ